MSEFKDVWHVRSLPQIWFDQNVLDGTTKFFKKSNILKISGTFILHKNNFEKLSTKWYKNRPVNNQVTYSFFISNEFVSVLNDDKNLKKLYVQKFLNHVNNFCLNLRMYGTYVPYHKFGSIKMYLTVQQKLKKKIKYFKNVRNIYFA